MSFYKEFVYGGEVYLGSFGWCKNCITNSTFLKNKELFNKWFCFICEEYC